MALPPHPPVQWALYKLPSAPKGGVRNPELHGSFLWSGPAISWYDLHGLSYRRTELLVADMRLLAPVYAQAHSLGMNESRSFFLFFVEVRPVFRTHRASDCLVRVARSYSLPDRKRNRQS